MIATRDPETIARHFDLSTVDATELILARSIVGPVRTLDQRPRPRPVADLEGTNRRRITSRSDA
jgi:hypothetical protein